MDGENKFSTSLNTLKNTYEHCTLCPRKCGANRAAGHTGICKETSAMRIASASPHFGEETCLVGTGGSGTVFFTGCSLGCVFCQNYHISALGEGRIISTSEAADIFVSLQDMGCINLNLVTPTHFVPSILEALDKAVKRGFNLPVVYNCGGYESVETLKALDGAIDIYMPDAKFMDSKTAERLARAPDYPAVCKAAIKEMHRQVGDLVLDEHGTAVRGLLVRHLVMPNGLAGSEELARFLAEEISKDTAINVMAQYRPCFKAHEFPDISRRPHIEEIKEAVETFRSAGLHRFM